MPNSAVGTDSLATDSTEEYTGKKLGLAIVGCGGVSEMHLRVLKDFPDVEIVAGVDIKPERLDVMRDKYGITNVYEDWREMLAEIKPDAVDVCTPNGVHAAACIDASKAGCHVITEKPMAMNPAECEDMIQAAKDAGKKLVTGFQFRYHPATQMIKRAREEGQFGNIMFVKCRALRRRGIPNWGVFGRKELQGGGPLIDIGVHVLEVTHYLMGAPRPVAATGVCHTYIGNQPPQVQTAWGPWDHTTYTVEDLAVGLIRFEDGSALSIEASFAAHIEKNARNFVLMGEKGGATYDPPAIHTDIAGTMVNITPDFVPKSNEWDVKMGDWIESIRTGKTPSAPGEHGLIVQKMLDGIYRSAETGREVEIA